MEYRREIDGLRALAVVPVILFHAGFSAFSGGFVGVDVFFVISGYLITSIILSEKQAGIFTFASFYERRARRILPALFLVLLVCLPFAWLWLLPVDMKNFSQSLVAVAGFSSNFFFYLKGGYFDTASELKPLLHTWSLAVEEQYYLLFPIFLVLTLKSGKRRTVALLFVMAISSLAAAQRGASSTPGATFFLLPTRGWELLSGAFIAFYLENDRVERHSQSASAFGLLLITFAVFAFDGQTPFPSLYALVPTIGAVLIIVFATRQTVIGKLLGCKLFVGGGLVSYSAYLWHQPILAFLRYRTIGEPSDLHLAAAVLAAGTLAYFSWKYVERPFRDRRRFGRKEVLAYGAIGSATFAALGLAGHLANGIPARESPGNLPKNYFEMASNARYQMRGIDGNLCVSETASVCRINHVPGAGTVLLVGDSHSADYSIEFRRHAGDAKLNAFQLSVYACIFLDSQRTRHDGECGKATQLLRGLLKNEKFDTIVFVGDLYGHTAGSDEPTVVGDMGSLTDLLSEMLGSGAKVIFFTPRYTLSTEPTRAAMLNKLSDVHVVGVNPSYLKHIDERLTALSAVPNFKIFDERDYLVSLGGTADGSFNGHTSNLEPLYVDTNHLTNFGAKLVFRKISSMMN